MGMVKLITPGSQDFAEPVAQLIKVSSHGLVGEDRKLLVKRASEQFTDKLSSMSLKPGDVPIHLLAIGAGEYYGQNRNGDNFSSAVCKTYHDTFRKYAKWFRRHQNSDPKKGRGFVKLSSYNPDMHRIELLVVLNGTKEAADRNGGLVADKELEKLANNEEMAVSMGCFTPGTPVKLANGGEQSIELLKIGDRVTTHHGNIGKVYQLHVFPYDGDLVRFRASGLPDDVVCTPDHKIWVRPSRKGKTPRCPVCGKQFKSLQAHLWQKQDPQHQAAYRDYSKYAENWFPAEQLAAGDYVRTPFSTEILEQGDPVYAELLGFYLSEGNTYYYKKWPKGSGVDFSFSSDEQHFIDRVTAALDKLGYSRWRIYHRKKQHVRLIRVTSPELAKRLEADAGRYSHGKRLAPRFMTWAPKIQMKIFAAFMDGDGCFHKLHRTLIATTVSRQLAFQLAEICWRNAIPARIAAIKREGKRRAYNVHVQGRFVENIPCDKKPSDFVFQDKTQQNISHLLYKASGTTAVRSVSATLSYVENGFVYHRIVRTARESYSGKVYNIAVSEDNSYVVNGTAVANCHVPADFCSSCNNEAKTRAEYCDADTCDHGGLKHNMGKVFSDGHVLYADNREPTFFDISDVLRPADRIAYVLGKAAEADQFSQTLQEFGECKIGGAEMAERLKVACPPWLLAEGPWHDGFVVKQARVLTDLLKHETEIDIHSPTGRVFDMLVQPIAQDMPNLQRCGIKIGTVVREAAKESCMLPIGQFLALLAPNNHDLCEITNKVASCLPGVYSRLVEKPQLEELMRTNPYRPTGSNSETRKWIRKHATEWSLARKLVVERLQLATIRNPGGTHNQKEGGFISKAAQDLAQQYALYQLAFLAEIPDHEDAELARELAVQHNYAN